MPNTSAIIFRLGEVDIVPALIYICNSLYGELSVRQQDQLHDDIIRQLKDGQFFLLVLLEPDIKVFSEFQVYMRNSEEQRHIKQLLNKKLPIILAVSIFDECASAHGDISVVGYSRLLDRVSSMSKLGIHHHQRLLKSIRSRRMAWRLSYKAVTMDEFLEALRKEYEN